MSSKALMAGDKEILPFEIGHTPEFVALRAKEELNETPERKIKGVQELRCLLQRNSETEGFVFHDDVLVAFLRRNKYRVNDAHQQIQNLIHLYRKKSNFLNDIPDAFLELPSSKFLVLLPMRCQDGCALFNIRWGQWDPSELPMEGLQQMMAMALSFILHDPVTQINGLKGVHDFQGLTFKHVRHFTPHNVHLFYHGTVNCFPLRYKAIHVLHGSTLMKIGWRLIKPLLTEKMKSRIFFHSSSEELLDFFPSCVLPTYYGGSLRGADMPDWARRVNKDLKKYALEQPNYY